LKIWFNETPTSSHKSSSEKEEEGAPKKEIPIDPSKLHDEDGPHRQKFSVNLEDPKGEGLQALWKENMLQM
jgi:hypothetical protein